MDNVVWSNGDPRGAEGYMDPVGWCVPAMTVPPVRQWSTQWRSTSSAISLAPYQKPTRPRPGPTKVTKATKATKATKVRKVITLFHNAKKL